MRDLQLLAGGDRLLVLLHGHGDDPGLLATRRPELDPQATWTVAVPTGPVVLPDGAPAWFDDGSPADADRLRAALGAALTEAGRASGTDPATAVVVGWSQGAAAALTLATAEGWPRVAAVAAVAGWLPTLDDVAWSPDPGATVLGVHGVDDEVVPLPAGRAAARLLARAGAAVTWTEHDAGHELTPAMLADVAAWLDRIAAGERPTDA